MPLQTVFSSGIFFFFKHKSDCAAPLLKPFEGWFQTTHKGLEGPTWPACACMVSHSVVSDSLQPHGLDSPWNSPGQNTGGDSLSLLQGIFPTQESNWGLLRCRRILYQLSYQGSPDKRDIRPQMESLVSPLNQTVKSLDKPT